MLSRHVTVQVGERSIATRADAFADAVLDPCDLTSSSRAAPFCGLGALSLAAYFIFLLGQALR